MTSLWARLAVPFGMISAAILLSGCSGSGIEAGAVAVRKPQAESALPTPNLAGLLDPSRARAQPPEFFSVTFETSQGTFVVDVESANAPLAASRFYNLVNVGYYDDIGVFRVVPRFVAQFGINGDPRVTTAWENEAFPDEQPRLPNTKGSVVFANAGPGTRNTQIYVNLVDNQHLDPMGFVPFGRVVSGFDVVASFFPISEQNGGPDQTRITSEGNGYLHSTFPDVDWIYSARITSVAGQAD